MLLPEATAAVSAASEVFDLSMLGGVTERRYRALRPDIEQFPWGTLALEGFSEAQVACARHLWTNLCLEEYAAAARMGDVLRLLVRARAPLDLCATFTVLPLDEFVHAELCARVADELGGGAALEYRRDDIFPPPSASTEASPVLAATRAVLWEFCVLETRSHGLLVSHLAGATQPLLRAVWGRLARDEAVHMQFGWVFLEWALGELTSAERASLRPVAEGALGAAEASDAQVRALPDEAFSSLSVFGSEGRAAYLALGERVLEVRVRERLRAAGLL